MYFSGPEALWGLLLLAVPFVVHFFSLRKARRVYFSDLRFLQQITQVTRNRETIRRKLILAARLLAVLSLVLLFAGWSLNTEIEAKSDSGVTSVFIDNSPSTALFSQEGSLLDEMRTAAVRIAQQTGPAEQFQLITAELRPGEQQLLSKESFLSELAAVKSSAATRPLSQILERQKNAIRQRSGTGNRYVLSDFQSSFSDWKNIRSDSLLKTNLLCFQAPSQRNLFIDSAWMASPVLIPGQSATMVVRINNSGQEETVTIPWSMELNGQKRLNRTVTIPGNSKKLDSLVFTLPSPGWHTIKLTLRDHPVTFDDQYYYSLNLRDKIKVLVISPKEPSFYLKSFFDQEPFLEVQYAKTDVFNASMANEAQVIIAEGIDEPANGLGAIWANWLKQGKALMMIPGAQSNPAAWTSLLQPLVGGRLIPWQETNSRLRKPALNEPFFAGVFNNLSNQTDWPEIIKTLQPAPNSGSGLRELLSLERGGGLLYQSMKNGAFVYWLSTPLDPTFGNFPTHPLWVPVLYRICLIGTGSQNLTAKSGQSEQVPMAIKLQQDQILTAGDDKQSRIPLLLRQGGQIALSFQNDRPWEPGFYPLQIKGLDTTMAILAMNRQYEESVLTFPDPKHLEREASARNFNLESVSNANTFNSQSTGQKVQKMAFWLALISLLALLAESILIRYEPWKKSLSKKPE